MQFTASIFNRSVTIELMNKDIYQMDQSVDVLLDGQKIMSTSQNVFSIMDLQPDHEYTVTVGLDEEQIHTLKESVLFNVKDFGASGDGRTNDTAYLQAAISACPKDGTVLVPKGTYYTSPLFLKSDMTLWLAEGAELLGSNDRRDYPVLPGMTQSTNEETEYNLTSWEGNPLTCFASLITAIGCEHVDIIGPGSINGNADTADWWEDPRNKRIAWRPNAVFMNACHHMRMQNVHVSNSPCWAIHPYYSEDLSFMNLDIRNPYNSPNTDGFDPESCRNVLLLGTKISVGDDCIAIKSGKYYMAANHYKATENIIVRNCRLERGHGSVTIGSEIACGVSGIKVEQCIFDSTDRGVRVKTRRGRGDRSLINDICFDNNLMDHVHMPITLNMFYFCDPDGHTDYVQNTDPMPVDDMTPKIGRIRIKNTKCIGVDSAFLCAYGLPEMPIEQISLENVEADFLPEEEQRKDRPVMMDRFEPIKGIGIWACNVKEIDMKNVKIVGSSEKEPILQNVSKTMIND
ncbi:MAG: glycoside hydrolase family 28 protein [Erysipelotrichaceae bacterium]|nr:glycoside hydrolase family 28 protein [Erysipelotrichaceae bacterium]